MPLRVFRAPRRNNVRLALFMDVGGTMDPYYEPVSRLLTALHEERGLRDFKRLIERRFGLAELS